ncbi:hypothetical protein CDCA_CDCA08G2344 [Cyanidium caldarium]|uniref:Alkyl hydroperoxide reductase subunit C/ Thiol specific antioxidant domain-containing protein n=1 Tax=Cyanidium caldarium TaxID=2771 RepID=A0AAV9IVK7_CYACA|nr:hypothetical protein CDCA_CDCA08G2344 [Cyanidium caldarium]|eukprot:ctg_178.g130
MFAVYRGSWCAVCRAWLRRFLDVEPSLSDRLTQHDGVVYLVSAQDHDATAKNAARWGIAAVPRVTFLPDPDHALVEQWSAAGIARVQVSGLPGPASAYGHRYRRGIAQPALLIFVEGRCVYAWTSVPRWSNLGGATARPDPVEVLETLFRYLQEGGLGKQPAARIPDHPLKTWVFFRKILSGMLVSNGARSADSQTS